MSNEVEAWAVIYNGNFERVFETKKEATNYIGSSANASIVKLTGKIPRQLRTISTEVWIEPRKTQAGHDSFLTFRLGIESWDVQKTDRCNIKARITLEEIADECSTFANWI